MLDPREEQVLANLAAAWNIFLDLSDKYPTDLSEFQRAIIQAQAIIALRVARRDVSDHWFQPVEA